MKGIAKIGFVAALLTVSLLGSIAQATNLTTDQILNASFYVVADNNYAEVSRADN